MYEPNSNKPQSKQPIPLTLNDILQKLLKADIEQAKELFNQYSKTIIPILERSDIFDEETASILSVLVKSHPQLVCEYFNKYFSQKFKMTKEIFNSDSYRVVLNTLFELATEFNNFAIAANHLLTLAASEPKTGIYHGDYVALHTFASLFANNGAKTKASLQQRKDYLEQVINQADKKDDYYRLFILMQTLGDAANVFETGGYATNDDVNFESYIHFAVDKLLHYAGKNDESGLHFTAEKELHDLLKCTINEPDIWGAHDIPYRIFKHYVDNDSEWDIAPYYHLNDLQEQIEKYKKEKDEIFDDQYVHELERRLEKFVSYFADREFLSEDFTLFLGSKKKSKFCEIGVAKDELTNLDLHQRQSLAERLIFKGTTNLHDIDRGWPKTTYVVANLGLVLSDRPHKKNGNHKRVFRTMPIKVPDTTITGREHTHAGHAEEALYTYLLDDKTITDLVSKFKEQYGINSPGHKVYAVILDLHGTYDMCLSCSKHGLEFQKKFREKLFAEFKKQNLNISANHPNQLPVIIRYSSDLKYHYPGSEEETKRGVPAVLRNDGEKRELKSTPPESNESCRITFDRDIKYFGPNLLIHGKSNWHSFWNPEKRQQHKDKPLKLESWTAFTTKKQASVLSDDKKRLNYTLLGGVDTQDDADALQEDMNSLTI